MSNDGIEKILQTCIKILDDIHVYNDLWKDKANAQTLHDENKKPEDQSLIDIVKHIRDHRYDDAAAVIRRLINDSLQAIRQLTAGHALRLLVDDAIADDESDKWTRLMVASIISEAIALVIDRAKKENRTQEHMDDQKGMGSGENNENASFSKIQPGSNIRDPTSFASRSQATSHSSEEARQASTSHSTLRSAIQRRRDVRRRSRISVIVDVCRRQT